MEADQGGHLSAGAARNERWVLASAILASALAFIAESALTVSLPALQADLSASGAELLWIVNAYTLPLASLILVGGSLGDQIGRRKVFMAGIGLFGIAALACGLAPSAPFLIAARVVQGLGGALMIPGSLALITAVFPAERRGAAIGTWAAVTTVATIAAPLLGGLLAEAGLWRVVFLLPLPLAAASLLALRRCVAESLDESRPARIDWLGATLVTAGLGGLAYGFTSAPALGFSDPRVWGALAGGTAALAGFVAVERRRENPMLPLGLFSSRTFTGVNLLTLFLYGGLYGYLLFFTLNLIQAQGYRESLAGLGYLPFVVLLAAISRWAGRLADRIGYRLPLIFGPALVAGGILAHAFIGLTDGPRDYWVTFFPATALVGIGMGITVAPLTTAVMSSVAAHFAGTASGVNNAVSRIAAVLAVAALGAVALFSFSSAVTSRTAALALPAEARLNLQAETGRLGEASVPASVPADRAAEVGLGLRLAFVDAFRLVMILCAGLALAGALLARALVERKPPPRE
jgi:EmrB/QacA subfamily drug resistance transporter